MKNKTRVITRRDFIRGTIGATLGASVFGVGWPTGEATAAGSSLYHIVAGLLSIVTVITKPVKEDHARSPRRI